MKNQREILFGFAVKDGKKITSKKAVSLGIAPIMAVILTPIMTAFNTSKRAFYWIFTAGFTVFFIAAGLWAVGYFLFWLFS